ncbi:predicted protein [Histoplasma capsulatum var. duboisii H88]|uniref:Predicted protein n=1 Tax=Ajellomyces capsulatus (strain H88) TaxID=544711 RepID=F0U9I9_AJEC8|nr:predicted protein [Histoplasma capsulatum var. duboisii H88]
MFPPSWPANRGLGEFEISNSYANKLSPGYLEQKHGLEVYDLIKVSNAFLKPPAQNPQKTLELTRHPTPVELRFPRVCSLPTETSFRARDPPTSRAKKASCPDILNGQLVCASCFANVLRHILKPEHTLLRISFHSSREAPQDKPLQLCLYAEYSTTRP